jgi:hypothetical protein
MKYLGDLFRISLLVLILYTGISIWNSQASLTEFNQSEKELSKFKLNESKIKIEQFLTEGRFLEACLQAGAEHRSGNIFAYVIDAAETPCWEGKEFIELIQPQLTPNIINEFTNTEKSKFIATSLQTGQVKWVLVNKHIADATFFDLLKKNKTFRKSVIKDIYSVLQIMLIIIFIFSILLVEDLQGQLRKVGKESKWLLFANKLFGWFRPKYIKMAVTAQAAQISQTDELTKQLEFISTSLQSTVLQEIQQNKSEIPYTFSGTVARVDINAFSVAVMNGRPDQVTTITDKFLEIACELMQRYDGLFEKALGDEVIVVFKENHQLPKSSLRSVAFCRDLMAAYSELEFTVGNQKNKFHLKSSMNKSEITFLLGHAGPVFSGDALTYTKRILDSVTIKDRNIIASLASEVANFEKLVTVPNSSESFDFKNMNKAEGYQIEKFLTVEEAYDFEPNYLQYFKSDLDICFLFQKIMVEENPQKLALVFKCLRQINIYIASDELVKAWISAVDNYQNKTNRIDFKTNFANLISAGLRLIPQGQWTQECTSTVASISRKTDGRINAAVVELLADKKSVEIVLKDSDTFLMDQDPSFRTAGNLLIAKALFQLNEDVLSDILNMLLSDNKLRLSTGVFVAGQVLGHYDQVNPAGLRTFSNYKKITQQLTSIQANKMEQLSSRIQSTVKTLVSTNI